MRKRDHLWDALVDELGEPATKSERGARNAALKELREIDATPEQVRFCCQSYRMMWPNITLTPTALVKHWTTLARRNAKPTAPVTAVLNLPELSEADRLENLRRARELGDRIGRALT